MGATGETAGTQVAAGAVKAAEAIIAVTPPTTAATTRLAAMGEAGVAAGGAIGTAMLGAITKVVALGEASTATTHHLVTMKEVTNELGLAFAKTFTKSMLAQSLPIAVLVTTIEAFKHATEASAKWEEALSQVSVMVRNAGGDAERTTAQIAEWAKKLAQTSIFMETDLVNAYRVAALAGMSHNTVLATMNASMELAQQKHISLTQASEGLAQAHNGRWRALIALGVVTRDQIRHDISWQGVIDKLTQRLGGSATEAMKTFAGVTQNLHANVDILFREIGDSLVPMLVILDKAIIKLAQAADPILVAFTAWEKKMMHDLAPKFAQFVKAMEPVRLAFVALLASGENLWHRLIQATQTFHKDFEDIVKLVGQTLRILAGWWRVELEAITTFLDFWIARSTGNWKVFYADLSIFAAAGLDALQAVFGNAFGHILASLDTLVDQGSMRMRGLFKEIQGVTKMFSDPIGGAMDMKAGYDQVVRADSPDMKALFDVKNVDYYTKLFTGIKSDASEAQKERDAAQKAVDALKKPSAGDINFKAKTEDIVKHPGGVGAKKPHEGPAPHIPALSTLDIKDPDREVLRQKALERSLRDLTISELKYKDAIAMATTEEQHHSALMAEKEHLVDNAKKAVIAITTQMDIEWASIQKINAQLGGKDGVTAQYKRAVEAHNSLEKSLAGSVPTKAEAAALRDLTRDVASAKKEYDRLTKELELLQTNHAKNAEAIKKHEVALKGMSEYIAGEALKNARAMTAEFNKQTQAVSLAGKSLVEIAEYWKALDKTILESTGIRDPHVAGMVGSSESAKNNEAKALQLKGTEEDDRRAMYARLLKDQKTYLEGRLAAEIAANGYNSKEAIRYRAEIAKISNEMWTEQAKKHETFIKDWQTREAGWIDGIITGQKSLKDTLKNIWNTIVADFGKMIADMIVKSAMFKTLNNSIFSFLTGGGGGKGGPVGGALGALSLLGAGKNDGGTGLMFQPSPAGAHGGTGAAVGGSGLMSFLPGIGVGLGGALLGRQIGGIGGAAMGGLSGAAGAAMAMHTGLFAAGPIGIGAAAIGAILGSGLFKGPNWGPPSNYPDRSDTQNFGQTVANLQGQMGANGRQFTESAAASKMAGGLTQIQAVEKLLAGGKPTWMSETDYAGLVAMFGKTEGGKLNFGQHIGEEWVTGSEGVSGQHFTYQELGDAATKTLEAAQKLGPAADKLAAAAAAHQALVDALKTPSFHLSRTYRDMNLDSLTPDQISGGDASLNGIRGIGGQRAPLVDMRGATIVGPGGVNEAAAVISKAMYANQNGTGVTTWSGSGPGNLSRRGLSGDSG